MIKPNDMTLITNSMTKSQLKMSIMVFTMLFLYEKLLLSEKSYMARATEFIRMPHIMNRSNQLEDYWNNTKTYFQVVSHMQAALIGLLVLIQ